MVIEIEHILILSVCTNRMWQQCSGLKTLPCKQKITGLILTAGACRIKLTLDEGLSSPSRWKQLQVAWATFVFFFFILDGTNSHDTTVYSMRLWNQIILWQSLFTVFTVGNQKECGDKWLKYALHHVQTSLICSCALKKETGSLLLQVLKRTRQTTHCTWFNPESPGNW